MNDHYSIARRRIVTFFIIATLTLGGLELGLRLAERMLSSSSPLFKALEMGLRYKGELFWQELFVTSYSKGCRLGRDAPDSFLGWSPRSNFHVVVENNTYTHNEMGVRASHPFVRDPSKRLVLTIGDSFTYGVDVGDNDTWPALLEAQDSRLQVINMGVAAYGIDQMCLRLENALKTLKPDLVVVAFIGDDLERALVGYRDFKKPRFDLHDEKLVLVNTPIPPMEEVYHQAKADLDRRSSIKLAILAYNFTCEFSAWRLRDRLSARIFERMIESCRVAGAEFLLAYLPYGEELTNPSIKLYGEEFFEIFSATHTSAALNLRRIFLDNQRKSFSKGHYSRSENEIVAKAAHEYLISARFFEGRSGLTQQSPSKSTVGTSQL